jgi:transcriptional regulator with XRE-family HTH domain
MKRESVGSIFGELRAGRNLTMADAASKSGLSEALIWNVEHDRPVRWETVHRILVRAFRMGSSNEKYQRIRELWLKSRQEKASGIADNHSKRKLPAHAIEATRKFRNLVRDLNEETARRILAAAERSARSLRDRE